MGKPESNIQYGVAETREVREREREREKKETMTENELEVRVDKANKRHEDGGLMIACKIKRKGAVYLDMKIFSPAFSFLSLALV